MGPVPCIAHALATAWLVAGMGAPAALSAATTEQNVSTVTVTVEFVVLSGVQPAGGSSPPSPRVSPAVGIPTAVVPVGGPATSPLATAMTNAAGTASFSLPAGSYWVVVPRLTSPPPGSPGPAIATELPDGTLVQGWTRVDLAADANADATIRLTVPLP